MNPFPGTTPPPPYKLYDLDKPLNRVGITISSPHKLGLPHKIALRLKLDNMYEKLI